MAQFHRRYYIKYHFKFSAAKFLPDSAAEKVMIWRQKRDLFDCRHDWQLARNLDAHKNDD